jgi:hypothetical protein
MTSKKIWAIILMTAFCSCKSATQRWMDSMVEFKEINGKALSLQVMKMAADGSDTTSFAYKIRIYPAKTAIENYANAGQPLDFYYRMDSCFYLRQGAVNISPVIVEPVNNGIANCYEYLLYFNINKTIKLKHLDLVYADKFIDGKQYALGLN